MDCFQPEIPTGLYLGTFAAGLDVQAQGLGKISQLWALKCGTWLIFPEIVVIVVQSGLKLYDLTVMAAGVQMNEFV